MSTPMSFGAAATDTSYSIGDNSGRFMKYFNKDGKYLLRFLDDWTDWWKFYEHYDPSKRLSYPCSAKDAEGRKNCPGCQMINEDTGEPAREAKPSMRYLTNAVLLEGENSGYVDLWKLPAGLKKQLVSAYEKRGTLLDRPYTIVRGEENGRTSYFLEAEDKEDFDFAERENLKQDYQEALLRAWNEAFDPSAIEEREERMAQAKDDKPKAETTKVEVAKPAPKEEEEIPDALLTEAERAAKQQPVEKTEEKPKAKVSLAPEPEPEPEEEPLTLTVSGIKAMSIEQIKKLSTQAGFDLPETDDQAELANAFIEALSS